MTFRLKKQQRNGKQKEYKKKRSLTKTTSSHIMNNFLMKKIKANLRIMVCQINIYNTKRWLKKEIA